MTRGAVFFLLLVALCAPPAPAQETAPAHAQELIERERTRAAVEAAMTLGLSPSDNGAGELDNIIRGAAQLREVGAAAVPYLVNELDQANPRTFHFCAFALGHFDDPEATAALVRAIERADDAPGDFALARKGWAAYGLALQGRPEAVDLVNDGKRSAGRIPVHGDTTVVEAAAILTEPASVPLLVAQLERYEQEERWVERRNTLQALGRVLNAEAIPAVVTALEGEDPDQRRFAAAALERGGQSVQAVDALMTALHDDDFRVRRAATLALEWIAPADRIPAALARLEVEDDAIVRGRVYRWIVRAGLPETLATLRPFWPATDPSDRFQFITALELLRDPGSVDILRQAVTDSDTRVMSRAIPLVADLGGAAGVEFVRQQVRSTVWPRAQLCAETLIGAGDSAHAEALALRLFSVELAQPLTDLSLRHRVELLGNGLVILGYTEGLPQLRAQSESQPDAVVKSMLATFADRLAIEERNKKKVKLWGETADDEEAGTRLLALRRLAALGGKDALAALVSAFGRADVPEATLILELLGGIDREPARDLIRRVLTDPVFDAPATWPLRDMAAWSARRLGGEEMAGALRDSVLRRRGRDAYPLAYLILLQREQALDVFAEVRLPRMRFLKYTRGYEFDTFDRMARGIAKGRSLREWDAPPSQLTFR